VDAIGCCSELVNAAPIYCHAVAYTAIYHCGRRTVGPRSSGEGRPGAGGWGSSGGGRRLPQRVRARISSTVAAVTKLLLEEVRRRQDAVHDSTLTYDQREDYDEVVKTNIRPCSRKKELARRARFL